jgi:hypothetical protein
MATFGELKRLDLRTIWQNEAKHFTPWLAENIERLGEVTIQSPPVQIVTDMYP